MRLLKFFVVSLVFVLLLPLGAFAISLDAAKAQGLVGEKPDGYIGAVGSASPEVSALIRELNS